MRLHERDYDLRTTRSGGPGGQHANKTDSAVVVTHKATGLSVRVETKSQYRNKELALGILRARLLELQARERGRSRNERRRAQVGSGQRGDKVRTIAVQRGQVTDHRTGKRTSTRAYLRGQLEDLWP